MNTSSSSFILLRCRRFGVQVYTNTFIYYARSRDPICRESIFTLPTQPGRMIHFCHRLLWLLCYRLTDSIWCVCLIQGECEELERQVDARCDALIRSIERRRQWLIDAVRQDKETKQRSLKEHVASCTCKLQKTTSLLQFCIEALKENDPVSFLQVRTGCILHGVCAIGVVVYVRHVYAHSVHPIPQYTHVPVVFR